MPSRSELRSCPESEARTQTFRGSLDLSPARPTAPRPPTPLAANGRARTWQTRRPGHPLFRTALIVPCGSRAMNERSGSCFARATFWSTKSLSSQWVASAVPSHGPPETIFLHDARCIRVPIRLSPAGYESCLRPASRPAARASPRGSRSDRDRPVFWLSLWPRKLRPQDTVRRVSRVSPSRPREFLPGHCSRCSILLGGGREFSQPSPDPRSSCAAWRAWAG